MADDLEVLGAPPEIVAQWREAAKTKQSDGPKRLPIMARNWPAIEAFCVAGSQWRFADTVHAGLDYPGCEAAWRLARIDVTPATFAGVRRMEGAAMAALAEKRKKQMDAAKNK